MPYRRRRHYGFGRSPRYGAGPKVAPAPDPMKLVNQKIKEVGKLYKAYIKTDVESNLIDALVSFDSISRMGLRFQKISQNFNRHFDIAGKCRARAMSTTFDGERNTALLMALRQMEKTTTFDNIPLIDTFLAAKAAKEANKGIRKARTPGASRTAKGPKAFIFGVSPYRRNSALDVGWQLMHSDYHTKEELKAAVTGNAKDPDFVVRTLFKNRSNREPGAAWMMEADPTRPTYFKLVILPGVPKP